METLCIEFSVCLNIGFFGSCTANLPKLNALILFSAPDLFRFIA